MAANPPFFLTYFFFSQSLLLLLSCSNGVAANGGVTEQSHHHVIGVNSLLPTTVCSSSSKGAKRPGLLQVVHRSGPCSPLGHEKTTDLSSEQFFIQDQERVDSIHSALSTGDALQDSKVSSSRLPAKSGRSLGTGNFVVTVGFGTPKQHLTLVFDTGSDLTWIQCLPCSHCYQQSEPIFNPSKSSSYSNLRCSSTRCSKQSSKSSNCTSLCKYIIQYADNSYSSGLLAREKLALTRSDVFPNFIFGCGQDNGGNLDATAGILGLGRSKVSLVSQTAAKFGRIFSYCLPPTSSSTGYLAFGDQAGASSSSLLYTPLLTDSRRPSFYFIKLVGISVGGRRLTIPSTVFTSSGTIIDTGTVITRLQPSAYAALRSAFRQAMLNYPSASAVFLFDTCYDLSGFNIVAIPKIMLHFEGGAGIDLGLPGIIVTDGLSRVCLAFAGNDDPGKAAIIGNKQQQTLEVVYDVPGGRLGFGSGDCST
ncbi:PREDICTED: aspartyl protease family protein At5g10770-like [Nelumbo nucifera]|uniref:Peptidase A1 domain-containing protein n=2 Tax=Nelumbo nucifera TaxID=4432 RepID=A0A822XQ43_NELNU|nr:PREDICTED: aspartyl protease family protein At5g10770-like [Nelumbo nucifera]DAD19588.1 TPA_asm: hypothetical protein HUJ06_021051 [Nelumbo nucifera]